MLHFTGESNRTSEGEKGGQEGKIATVKCRLKIRGLGKQGSWENRGELGCNVGLKK